MSINFKANTLSTMFHDADQAERDKLYDICRLERLSGSPLCQAVVRHPPL